MDSLKEMLKRQVDKRKNELELQETPLYWILRLRKEAFAYQVFFNEETNTIDFYRGATERGKAKDEKSLGNFLAQFIEIERKILKKKKEILDWVKKTYAESEVSGFTLYYTKGSMTFYLGFHPEAKNHFYAMAGDETFTNPDLDETAEWLFEKVKKPIQNIRLRELFKQ